MVLSVSRALRLIGVAVVVGLVGLLSALPLPLGAQSGASPEASDVAVAAFEYFYPLITMDITRKVTTNLEPGKVPGFGPVNAFSHFRTYPGANFKAVVRPNFDTLYSSAWLDLTSGPMVVSAPDTGGRYYLLPMLDMWTDIFASPGKRTTGTKAGHFAVVPPGWRGTLPAGVEKIQAPTPYVWIIGRTQTNGPADYDAVHKIQDRYRITPLSQWGKEAPQVAVKLDPAVDMKTPPLLQVNNMRGAAYFKYAAALMKRHPPHVTDEPILAQMKRIFGLEVGKGFDVEKLDPALKQALDKAPSAGLNEMRRLAPTIARIVNGWSMNTSSMGVYGTYYLKRAIIAMVGLGANLPEDAIYPQLITDAHGKPLVGDGRYVIHFKKGAEPPVNAFWSVTMYDADGFQVANPLNRFAVSSWMPFKRNADGSLDLYLQHASPGKDKESNWLPAPAKGRLGVTMRLYGPRPHALDGTWAPPAVTRVP